jgi:antitoxin ParD1/3/4
MVSKWLGHSQRETTATLRQRRRRGTADHRRPHVDVRKIKVEQRFRFLCGAERCYITPIIRFFAPYLEDCIMGTVRKTITFTEQQDQWIKAKIAAGQFINDSEYIRDLVRRDQEKTAEIEAIRAALIEGEHSGMSTRTPDDIRKAVRERMREHGQL